MAIYRQIGGYSMFDFIIYKYWYNKVKGPAAGYRLEFVPDKFKTYDLCLAAVKSYGAAIKNHKVTAFLQSSKSRKKGDD